ncbi:major facilitator superfamily transporter [Colletotrichum orchidophilum]|uniref:Major facilitator superfamily transporter n=1 Tax=Colletotrichum orchidophilum TaxID=1209926 RepID=A0A1G4BA47_9PEZI|nr:major facilitator superfamily transporter [Colletotrichum orchidophilum]OHE98284.1 major facilitator superfamily transporter [Colletotrichum orchidophilum]
MGPAEDDNKPDFRATVSGVENSIHTIHRCSLDVPKDEARFLTKLDLTLISASALGVMCRYLDQVNITNAFNSGMKEDLSLYGKELNYANAIWSAAYVFGQIPSNLLLTRVNAPLYIAFLEFAWTVFTFATAGVKDVKQLYVFRFFVGLFEAGHFPAVMYVCSSYYKPHELARRNTLIQIFTSVGPLFSGFLMAAVYAGLDGRSGLAGWRWMYMIFTEKEIEIARSRMPTEVKPRTGLFKWKDIKRWHTTWHVYLFPLFFTFLTQLGQSGGSMIFWVKSYNVPGKPARFSVAEINIIPLGINIISIVATLVNSWVSDSLPGASRWPGMLFASVMGIIFPIALAATPVHPANIATRWALYYLTALATTCAGITWTWVNETNRNDPEKRAYVSAMMNAFAYIFTAWVPIFTFPANLQPYIVTGNYITAGFGAASALTVLFIRYFYNKDVKRQYDLKI